MIQEVFTLLLPQGGGGGHHPLHTGLTLVKFFGPYFLTDNYSSKRFLTKICVTKKFFDPKVVDQTF